MKLNLISNLQKIKISKADFLAILFLIVVSIAFYQCRDESTSVPNKTESPVNTRGGEDEDPSSPDILELIGTACVPGSIFIGTG